LARTTLGRALVAEIVAWDGRDMAAPDVAWR
jgi:hypothetical protein